MSVLRVFPLGLVLVSLLVWTLGSASAALAGTNDAAFKQAVAEAAARDKDIAAFYKARGYKSLWTGRNDRQRRAQFLKALDSADLHGLPSSRYRTADIKALMASGRSSREMGKVEVELSKRFLQYARDLQTGALVPSRVDNGIVRAVPLRGRLDLLTALSKSSPRGFFRALVPQSSEYKRLMSEKLRMEKQLARGGWGPKVPAKSLKPGQAGASVVALRNRLTAMGYMRRSSSQAYDATLQKAVQQFQLSHGLNPDGVAGKGTIAQVNVSAQSRLQSIIVAMERERWINMPLGQRHVRVNLTDFSAKIIENERVAFSTRAVVGKNVDDRRSPEFSDVMEFMVINPSWYVPRSIATKEYLPLLKKNRNAVRHLEITDNRGRKINRGKVNFASYSADTFPFAMRQPPSRGNALGLVKFMFPNRHNIYLHDTPAKNLFSREVRAFSHGCIRLNDPFDFAYALLSKQMGNPQQFFQAQLATGKEQRVDLKDPLPVHLIYRTAFTKPKGGMEYRRDIYGRDAKIWKALSKAGVALRAVRG